MERLPEPFGKEIKSMGARGGTCSWFDLVHFDIHGLLDKDGAYLVVQSPKSSKNITKSGRQVIKVLQQYGITSSVLTSCNSAKVTGSSKSNLVRTFVEHGVHSTLAVSFEFSGSAAKELVTMFYKALLRDNERNMEKSVNAARDRLVSNRTRKGRFRLTVQLNDYLIPVYYTDGLSTPPISKDWDSSLPSQLDDTSVVDIIALFTSQDIGTIPEQNFAADLSTMHAVRRVMQNVVAESFRTQHCQHWTGHGNDILNVESIIFADPVKTIFSIYGTAGVGKTTLVTFLSLWWGHIELISTTFNFSLVRSADPEQTGSLERLMGTSSPARRGKSTLDCLL